MRWKTGALVLVLLLAGGAAHARSRAWSVRLGAQFDLKPWKQVAFSLGTENHYKIAGPVWFAFGSRLQVNGDYFGWTIEPGFVAKVDAGSGFVPTFRAAFMMGSKHIYDDWEYFNFYLGSSFGPGFLYDFESAAVGFDVSFDVARFIRYRNPGTREVSKPILFSILTAVVLEF